MEQEPKEELRKLPILRIHDTDFYVDLFQLEFRQVDNPANKISFRDVQDNIDHTQVMYDPKTKNAFKGTWGEMSMREDLVLVNLPAAINLDREGLINHLNKMGMENYRKRQEQKETPRNEERSSNNQEVKRRKGKRI